MTSTETDQDDGTTGEYQEFDQLVAGLEHERDHWRARAEKAEAEAKEFSDAAVAAAQSDPVAPEPEAEAVDDTDADDAPQDDKDDESGGDDAGGKAAKMRKRAQEAEAERDALREELHASAQAHADELDRVLSSVLAHEATRIGGNPEFYSAVGVAPADYRTEDGGVDVAALADAIEAKRVEFRIPRSPRPNPVVGLNRASALNGEARAGWDDAFRA